MDIAFEKKKNFLVCVDSDGCAMDTMEIKHRRCFCPKMIEIWNLSPIEKRVTEIWYEINLYSRTRGINRFKGLCKTLERLQTEGLYQGDFSALQKWVEEADELSNPALERETATHRDSNDLAMALEWSIAVNQAIHQLPQEDKPFPHTAEGLQKIHESADIAVVSSANSQAIHTEWSRHHLEPYTNVLLGQEAGSKKACIQKLLKYGYSKKHVLMVGDAPGDLQAAESNGVYFYPILVGKEGVSWKRLADEALGKLLDGSFGGTYQEGLIQEFFSVLEEN